MNYIKDSLYNTALPILIIESQKRYEYTQLGSGDEGSVRQYNDHIAFKTFDFTEDKSKLPGKFEKIELLGKLHDTNACFPIGLIGYEDLRKEGYFYELVNPHKDYRNFYLLRNFEKDMSKSFEYITEADEAIMRFHQMGLILGDIKSDNIMIDCDENVKFVDTDNWAYKDYGFDLYPDRAKWLRRTFNRNRSLVDNDRFVFAMMAIQFLIKGDIVANHHSDEYFKTMIELMDVSPEVKDGLRLIFSDAHNKPYISQVLKKIDPKQKVLSKRAIHTIKRIF